MTKYKPSTMWQERLNRRFDLIGVGHASLSAAYNAKLYAVRLEKLCQLLDEGQFDLAHKAVLEIGCGTGFYTAWFAEQPVGCYTGIDITKVSIAHLATRFPDFEFITADISNYAPTVAQYDCVFIADVLFHIVNEHNFRRAFAHICQALKPNGVLILSDLLAEYDVQTAHHVRFRSLRTYQSLLELQGVKIQQVRPIFGLLHPPVLVNDVSLGWQMATIIWMYGLLRFGRQRWFAPLLGSLFARLDQHLLHSPSANIPNLKWLLATK